MLIYKKHPVEMSGITHKSNSYCSVYTFAGLEH